MSYCAVMRCTNYRKKCSGMPMPGISFHRFPNDPERLEVWSRMIRIQRGDPYFKVNQGSTRICSAHFLDDDFRITKSGRKKLKETALPRLSLPGRSKVKTVKTVNNHTQTTETDTQTEEIYIEIEPLALTVNTEKTEASQNLSQAKNIDSQTGENYFGIKLSNVKTERTEDSQENHSQNKNIDSQTENNYFGIKLTNVKTERMEDSQENHSQNKNIDSQTEEINFEIDPLAQVKTERKEESKDQLQTTNIDSNNKEVSYETTAQSKETESQEDLIDVDISDLDSIFDSPRTVALKNKIKKLEARDKMKSVKIKNLRTQNARLIAKIKSLKDIIKKV